MLDTLVMTQNKKKKLFIKTYGCQMNVYDSGKMADVLKPAGYDVCEDVKDANLVILNTCHIRENPTNGVYSDLGRIKQVKDKRSNDNEMLIVVAGCVGQAEGDEVFKRAPFVDIVVGPQSYHNLPELVDNILNKGKRAINVDFDVDTKFDFLPEESEPTGISSFLSIQEGCNEFCKFCVVPYTRGAEFSRPVNEVYREALNLTNRGAIELTLLGQNVNAYNGLDIDGSEYSLGRLVRDIAKIDKVKRIRYTTSHPRSMDDDLIAAHGDTEKLMPFLHLPVQSGSDKILHAMNRKHKRDYYLEVIEKLRKARPDIAFSSDFIVGYPGETDQDFEDTLELVKTVKYAQAYSFKYSKRPGTPAAVIEDQIPDEVKTERLAILQKEIARIQTEFNQNSVGEVYEVLFDRKGKLEDQVLGKSIYMQSVYVDNGLDYEGKICKVKITGGFLNSLKGEIIP